MFRKHGRTSIRSQLLLKHPKVGYLEMTSCDMSASGVLVRAELKKDSVLLPLIDVGDQLETQLESLDSSREFIYLKVARRVYNGLGLTFVL